jgi:hypothetical protein
MDRVPKFRLSLGQLVWTLNRGQPANARLRNEVRYLRQLGVPHVEGHVGKGRGNRILYSFNELIECGVALYAIRRGMKIADAAKLLIKERVVFRRLYRAAFLEQSEEALNADWVKSRGRISTFIDEECFLRVHDRYSEKPGSYELVTPGNLAQGAEFFGMLERFENDNSRVLVPLKKTVLELVAWAKVAPEIRPGRP